MLPYSKFWTKFFTIVHKQGLILSNTYTGGYVNISVFSFDALQFFNSKSYIIGSL